jgi:hypothetical protein
VCDEHERMFHAHTNICTHNILHQIFCIKIFSCVCCACISVPIFFKALPRWVTCARYAAQFALYFAVKKNRPSDLTACIFPISFYSFGIAGTLSRWSGGSSKNRQADQDDWIRGECVYLTIIAFVVVFFICILCIISKQCPTSFFFSNILRFPCCHTSNVPYPFLFPLLKLLQAGKY